MTDRSPEDELIAEAVKFGRSFQQMLRLHAQAGNWLERRRIRKQISLALREQRRTEETQRTHQLDWTQQMVDRYRVHASTVADRAVNPNIDHERRYRDAKALAEHADYLRSKIIANPRLSTTEQGIALDGLDAATTFPQFATGRLFDRAHKVKGIDALRYRARVAREKVGLERGGRDRADTRSDGMDNGRGESGRFDARLTWSDPRGWVWTESRSVPTEDAAAEWVRDNIASSDWMSGTSVQLSITDTHGERTGPRYSDYGEPREVAGGLLAYTDAKRRITERDTGDPRRWAQPQRADEERFTAIVGPSEAFERIKDPGAPRVPREDLPQVSSFGTREQAYDWTERQLSTYREHSNYRDGQFSARILEWDHPERTEHLDGPIGMVTDEVRALREQHLHRDQRAQGRSAEPATPAVDDSRIAEVERQLTDMAADRDRLGSRVEVLQRGLDAVTADRDEIRRKLGNAESQIESLKNRNQRLAAEIGELRDRPGVDAVAAERDRYKRERDEVVTKLAQRTPAQQRYGSRERVEFDKLGNTERWSRQTESAGEPQTRADSAVQGTFNQSVAEQMADAWLAQHGDLRDEPKMQAFFREWLTNAAKEYREQRSNDTERNGQRRNGIERSR